MLCQGEKVEGRLESMCGGVGAVGGVGHVWYKYRIFQEELTFCSLVLVFSLTLNLCVLSANELH